LPPAAKLFISPRLVARLVRAWLCALRLAVQDAALSRRKHGFDSRRARQSMLIVELADAGLDRRDGFAAPVRQNSVADPR
jgi:hypothetical protein